MTRGVGLDVCSVARVKDALQTHGDRFVARVVAGDADAGAKWTADKLARRWALKEAVAKACGTGIGGVVGFADIVVSHDAKGRPVVRVAGFEGVWRVSVGDDAGMAAAIAIWE